MISIVFLFFQHFYMIEGHSEIDIFSDISTLQGPNTIHIKRSNAKLSIPEDTFYISGANTKNLLDAVGIDAQIENVSIIGSKDPQAQFIIYYSYKPQGAIRVQSNASDIKALLQNKIVARYGVADVQDRIRWHKAPFYDQEKHMICYQAVLDAPNTTIVEAKAIYLGKGGYVSLSLTAQSQNHENALNVFKTVVDSFAFKAGNTYAEIDFSKNLVTNKFFEDLLLEETVEKEIIETLTGGMFFNISAPNIQPDSKIRSNSETYFDVLLKIAMLFLILKIMFYFVMNYLRKKIPWFVQRETSQNLAQNQRTKHQTSADQKQDDMKPSMPAFQNKAQMKHQMQYASRKFQKEYDPWEE